jgi:hypothetical protein
MRATGSTLPSVGDWYTIGLAVGLGLSIGVLAAAVAGTSRWAVLAATAVAAAAGAGLGFLIEDWTEAVAGALGGAIGALATAQVVGGALRRGGTRGGLALLVGVVALVLAALAFVPLVGYVTAVVVPALAARMRGRAAERYAGLRTLAK